MMGVNRPMSEAQAEYLRAIRDGGDLRRWNGWRRRQTPKACIARGWIHAQPSPGHGGPRRILTDEGLRALADFESR